MYIKFVEASSVIYRYLQEASPKAPCSPKKEAYDNLTMILWPIKHVEKTFLTIITKGK